MVPVDQSTHPQISGSKSDRSGRTIALCCLATISEGFDLQAPGVTLAGIVSSFSLTPNTQGLFLTIGTIGMMVGAVGGGRLADRFSRKSVLIASILLYGVFSIATMLSASISALLVARFATGVGLGGALPAVIAIAVESAPPSRREFAVGLLLAGPPIGGALVSLLAAILAAPDHWTSIYLVGGLLPIMVVAPALLMFLPKPRDVTNSARADPQTGVISTLFAGGRATQTIAIWAAFFTMLLVLFTFLGWLPTLLVSRGMIPRDAFLVQMAFNLGAIPGSILAGYMFGRRTFRNTALIAFFLVSCLTFLLLGGGPVNVSFVIATGMLAGVSVTGAQVIIYALAPGIYSTSGRATGIGFCVAAGRIGSAAGPLLVGLMISKHFAPAEILYALIPIFAISGALAFFVSRAISLSGDEAAMETFS